MTPGYKTRRAEKHRLQRTDTGVTEATNFRLQAEFDTSDKLGLCEGGIQALKGAINWVSLKSRATRTASFKNTSGKSSSDVVERSVDFYHGKKRDPRYAERVAAAEEATRIATEDHGDVIAQVVSSEPTAS
jgi:hypothetical protein